MAVLNPYANRIPPRGYLIFETWQQLDFETVPGLEIKTLGGGQSL